MDTFDIYARHETAAFVHDKSFFTDQSTSRIYFKSKKVI